MTGSVHVSQHIRCPADRAYSFIRDPANLPAWAAGVSDDMTLEFVARNDLGVLDHTVVLPDGTAFYNPMRVLPDGDECEVVFTLRPLLGVTDEDVEADVTAIRRDLLTLKQLLEPAES